MRRRVAAAFVSSALLGLSGCHLLLPFGNGSPDAGPPEARLLEASPPDLVLDQAGQPCGEVCPLGCRIEAADGAPPRCHRLTPTNGETVVRDGFDRVTGDLRVDIKMPVTVNTDTGAIMLGTNVLRKAEVGLDQATGIYWKPMGQAPGYPELSVFVLHELVVASGETVTVEGARALVLYATGSVEIRGTIISSPDGAGGLPRAGGFPCSRVLPNYEKLDQQCFGGEGSSGAPAWEGGCGGGGRRGAGGWGGNGFQAGLGGAGGKILSQTPNPLFGGCGGGSLGAAGGGGGAIQISSSHSILVDRSGIISMPGGGGGAMAGGGGSGGVIILEAPTVTVEGTLAANGGGGAGGGGSAVDGTDGTDSIDGAPGGVSDDKVNGGMGGALVSEAGAPGDDGVKGAVLGAGGGGGVGWIYLSAVIHPSVTGATSPQSTPGPAISTW
jgi:hypothetical protein